jgi:SAM-dependent methyltransferase
MKKVYLGAGQDRKPGFIHVDNYPFEGIDVVADLTEKFPFDDSSVDYLFSQDFLEHIDPTKKVHLINECWRVLKNGGQMEHFVPNAGSRNDFGSPSHISHWNLQQFDHFNVESYRYDVDHEYEGFIGKFKKVLAEEINFQEEYFGMMPQSIHIIMEAIK